jgi:hypothetical protein
MFYMMNKLWLLSLASEVDHSEFIGLAYQGKGYCV